MTAPLDVDQATEVLDRFGHSEKRYVGLSELSGVSLSTLWHRHHGRASRRQKAANQQYLTQQEEKALVSYLLRMSRNGYPLPIKFVRDLALVIARHRNSIFQITAAERDDIRQPGKKR
jgi:hypothetical protein